MKNENLHTQKRRLIQPVFFLLTAMLFSDVQMIPKNYREQTGYVYYPCKLNSLPAEESRKSRLFFQKTLIQVYCNVPYPKVVNGVHLN